MQATTDNIYVLTILGMSGTFLLVTSFILLSIRNQNKMLKQRQKFQQAEIAHQKELLGAIIVSQEDERKRIGQDLHDDVGTTLSGLRMLIEMFNPANGHNHMEFIQSSKTVIDKVVKDVRNISHNLSPATLGYYGLAAAVNEHCSIINQSGKLNITVINEADEILDRLELTVATALYRVIEELLNNTIKHSGADTATIKFSDNQQQLTINYNDSGKGLPQGIAQTKKGMGLQNIESRLTNINASYTIAAEAATGFNITINYPLIKI